jgi:hypothetical protein
MFKKVTEINISKAMTAEKSENDASEYRKTLTVISVLFILKLRYLIAKALRKR